MPLARARRRSTALAAAMLAGLGALAYGLAVSAESGPRPTFSEPARAARARAADAPVELAGSGSNLPITRALVDAFQASHPSARIVVHESIGSTGGVRAVADAAIDIGLVSRRLRESERDARLHVTPYALLPVVFVTREDHRHTVPHDVSSADIVAIFGGEQTRWESGAPIILFLRERGDSGQEAIAATLPGFESASAAATASGLHRVVYHDADLARAVASVSGGLGVSDLARVRDSDLRALRVDGVAPGPDTLEDGSYPFAKGLAFVTCEPLSRGAADFIAFTRTPQAQDLIRAFGALPRDR